MRKNNFYTVIFDSKLVRYFKAWLFVATASLEYIVISTKAAKSDATARAGATRVIADVKAKVLLLLQMMLLLLLVLLLLAAPTVGGIGATATTVDILLLLFLLLPFALLVLLLII